ncbi:MAG: methyltransferase domain-containing protein [Salinivirgaceae bacterium]|jgi:trans-aconitate 2-methyltransferase|nr:methyltransferase domain-containing protein [Salinivirgaceae bacterium]
MRKKDWNPTSYLKFNKERLLPSIDLLARIDMDKPLKIIDIGCGPGNSTQVLAQKWPEAYILGVDKSPSMIEKAKTDFPNQQWSVLDLEKEEINDRYDVIFSNATIQWIPEHFKLFSKFKNALNPNGIVAIQLPLFTAMPLGKSIYEISKRDQWNNQIGNVSDVFTIHNPSIYYDFLSELFPKVEIWETHYTHIFEAHQFIFDMIHSTGLRPYLNALNTPEEKVAFENSVLESINKDYPAQKNGNVLFPFKRLFLIAKN